MILAYIVTTVLGSVKFNCEVKIIELNRIIKRGRRAGRGHVTVRQSITMISQQWPGG